MRKLSILIAGLAALAITPVAPATAKSPGQNGHITFQQDDPASSGDTFAFTADPNGSNMQRLYPGHHGFAPHWSPDGSEIAVLSDAGLPCCSVAAVIVDPATGSSRVLSMPDPTLFTACAVWSADAQRLICEAGGDDPNRNGIYTIRSSDGQGLTRITSIPGGDDIPIDCSPNGRQIVFGRTDPTRPATANSALFVVNVNGSGLRRITPWGFSDDDGGWSPDGATILFGHHGSLYTVRPNGTGLARIPLATNGPANAFDASWSPDGHKIVFSLLTPIAARAGQGATIYIANRDGGDLASTALQGSKPDWGSNQATG